MESLWPKDLGANLNKAPVTILMEQASFLGEQTNNLVKATVEAEKSYSRDFKYAFYIVAPTLENYRYLLFDISHGVELFPVTFDLDGKIREEIKAAVGKTYPVAQNEQEFMEIFKAILNSNKLRNIINSILAQSKAFIPQVDDDIAF